MPQFSPMSWSVIAFFLVVLILSVYASLWWASFNFYSVSRAGKRVSTSSLFRWGKFCKS
uniref:ATP synthase F0 subunit 8 n=1 Tax=Microcondylaea bonellii TaxID=1678567 RepID=A0A513X0D5_9BIVA|nr:ATP synthase F0 subunit 8 [Microcondylaea bonellii]